MTPPTEDYEPYLWGKDEPMNAEAIENYLRVVDSAAFIVVPEPLWAAHPIMGNLRETPPGAKESAYYFTGLSTTQKREWSRIRFWSQDPDSNRFERMLLAGEDRPFPHTDQGGEQTRNAELWWAGRLHEERWLVEVPRELVTAATAHITTDLDANRISDELRAEYHLYLSGSNDYRSLQRSRWSLTDGHIIMAASMGR